MDIALGIGALLFVGIVAALAGVWRERAKNAEAVSRKTREVAHDREELAREDDTVLGDRFDARVRKLGGGGASGLGDDGRGL